MGGSSDLDVDFMAGSVVMASDWSMLSVLFAHSPEGVPAGTEVIFGGGLLVILDIGGQVRPERKGFIPPTLKVTSCGVTISIDTVKPGAFHDDRQDQVTLHHYAPTL